MGEKENDQTFASGEGGLAIGGLGPGTPRRRRTMADTDDSLGRVYSNFSAGIFNEQGPAADGAIVPACHVLFRTVGSRTERKPQFAPQSSLPHSSPRLRIPPRAGR